MIIKLKNNHSTVKFLKSKVPKKNYSTHGIETTIIHGSKEDVHVAYIIDIFSICIYISIYMHSIRAPF